MSFKKSRDLKKGIDRDLAIRKREETGVTLRKQQREKEVQKRRMKTGSEHEFEDYQDPEIAQEIADLPNLAKLLYSDDLNAQLEAATRFRKLLSIERNPPIKEVVDVKVVPQLVKLLASKDTNIQFEAAWALTNIASGTTDHTRLVVESGSIPYFVRLLMSESEDVREQAVWALGNIAGDSHKFRDLVLENGVMKPLLQLFQLKPKLTMLRNATWTLSNLCRGKPQPSFKLVAPALPTLANLIYSKDDDVLTDAFWALSYLSDDSDTNQKIQAVIQAGVSRRLVQMLVYDNPSVVTPALRTVGNIVTGDDLQTQVMINCSVLPALLALLSNPKRAIRKETCWAISNITAGSPDQIQAVINANIIPPLVTILRNAEFDVKKEAVWALSNITSGGNDEQIRYLVSQGVIAPLCDILADCPDVKIVEVALEGIENILRVGKIDADENGNHFALFVEECGGLKNIDQLQHHENQEVYERAAAILRDYFDATSEDVQPNVAPIVENDHFKFHNPSAQQQYKF